MKLWSGIAVLATLLGAAGAARAQSCMRTSEMPQQDRQAIERAAQQVFDQAGRGDTEAMRANTVGNYFSGIAAAVIDNKSILGGARVRIREEYLLEVTGSSS